MSKLKSSNRHIERDALRAFLDADEVGMADERQQIPALAAGAGTEALPARPFLHHHL
jgi:hypothetical protein